MAVVREGDNVILEGVVDHGVYPTHHEELEHGAILRGRYEVKGGIYAKTLHATGSGTVHGPVVTREDLLLDERHLTGSDCHVFLSGLTAPTIVRNMVPAFTIEESCVRELENAKLRVRGPVLADTVHLSNALIIGNIHARQATLEACVVFGTIECDDLLILNTCTFVAYRAGRVQLRGRLTTWLGYGVSHDGVDFLGSASTKPHLLPGSDAHGRPVPPDLRYLPVCMSGTACEQRDDFETCDLYHDGRCPACVSSAALIPRASLLDLDFQLHFVRRSDRDPLVDVSVGGNRTSKPLSAVLSDLDKGVIGRDVPVTIAGVEAPLETHPAYLDYDPQIMARGSDWSLDVPIRLSALASRVQQDREPASILIRAQDDLQGWQPFVQHPLFRDRFLLSRVLNVAGRLLDTHSIHQSLTAIVDVAHAIAHYPYLDEASRARVLDDLLPRLPQSTQSLFRFGIADARIGAGAGE